MELITEAFTDALRVLPFLFFIYLLIEYLEHENNGYVHKLFVKSKKAGPILGALFGTIPQCGFSVIASELFAKKAISLGTLIAIFVATSDEAIPLMLAHPDKLKELVLLIAIKFIFAVFFGFAIDFLFHRQTGDSCGCTHGHFHGNCESCEGGIIKSAIIHSLKIFIFLFAANVILGYAAEFFAPFMEYVANAHILQIFASPLFGIIPNCAASVVLTELYLSGKITLAALTGGLCTGAGVGLVVLFRKNKNIKQNLSILALIYAIGVLAGLILLPIL